jgi:hypothetical protein
VTDKKRKYASRGVSAIVVPCGARKEKLSALLHGGSVPRGSQAYVASEWTKRLRSASRLDFMSARDMYAGRTQTFARDVADTLGCRYFIASAGLGLVHGDTPIPGYDLTLSQTASRHLQSRVAGSAFDHAKWWRSMQAGPFATPMGELAGGRGRILIGLTQPYAALIGAALATMTASQRTRMRIFGFGVQACLPEVLHSQIVAYDARLDRVLPGTKRDGFLRALTHFAKLAIDSPLQGIAADQALVDASLSTIALPRPPIRQRVSDDTLLKYIRRYIRQGHATGTALRHLRRAAGVACEEGRFRRLYQGARV